MDRLPLVPRSDDHEVLPLVTEILQNTLREHKYPHNIAENYRKYKIDSDYADLQTNGLDTIKVLETLEPRLHDISSVEEELMRSHAFALIQKDRNLPLIEELRLKRFEFFQKLSDHALTTYQLIQRSDLYPNKIEQYLDFTYNPSLHTCKQPCPFHETEEVHLFTETKKKPLRFKHEAVVSPFIAEPDKIIFWNYELGEVYKQKFKLRNISKVAHNFNYYPLPKDCPFHLKMLTDFYRLAPGMYAEFQVKFQPENFINCTEFIKFRTVKGVDLNVLVTTSRDSPKLICYVVNTFLPWYAIKQPAPGSRHFSERRRSALNFTIDCGTCLLGNYSLISVIMKNEGQRGRFLVATENEWVFNDLKVDGARACEVTQGCFTVFPAIFEIDTDEVGQIVVAFVPEKEGVFTEKFVIICDNTAHLEVEVLGDCLMYSDNFLKVNMYILEDTFTYNHRVISITLVPYQTSGFLFSIVNNSPLHFDYYWKFKSSSQEQENKKKMSPDWINILYNTHYLPTFSTTDVIVQLTAETGEEGFYYIFLSLYLKNIPTTSMQEYDTASLVKTDCEHIHECDSSCTLEKESDDVKFFGTKTQLADVHIFELEINCAVKLPETFKITVTEVSLDIPGQYEEPPSLRLSKLVLNFGVIHKGVTACKNICVENLTDDEIDWKIVEIYYTDESTLRITSPTGSLSHNRGTLKGKHKKKLRYTVDSKEPKRWISILVLFSCPTCTCQAYILESVCLVAYQVAEINITIRTDNHMGILCPREFIYVGIPSTYTIYVHNAGVVIGCFYFLKPVGEGAQHLHLKFHPQSGVLQPGATVDVKVELTPLKNGVFEHVHVPCFVGDPDRLIALRILCSVASINVHFYLPDRDKGYNRYLWPPKGDMPWEYTSIKGEDLRTSSAGGEWTDVEDCVAPDDSLLSLIAPDSVALTYPTIKAKPIHVKKATKLIFYIENLTPVMGHYTVDASNYGPENDCLHHILVKAKTRTPEYFWEKACLEGYGIVIEPTCRSGDIVPYEVLEVELWIYANTWGKYLEEIIVEINDLTPFCFNLVIDVVGLPVEFPFARNTTLPCPTIRFGNINYATESNTKCFSVTNISAVTLQINWHTFSPTNNHAPPTAPLNFLLEFVDDTLEFVMAKKFYGCEACSKCIDIKPCYFVLEPQMTVDMSVTVTASGFVSSFKKTSVKYTVVGFIGLKTPDRYKENYYKRTSGIDGDPAKVAVLVTMELPIMQLEISSDETTIDIFVNDLLLRQQKIPEVYLLLKNVDMSSIIFSIDIEKPFKIVQARTVPSGITDTQNLVLERHECLQVTVTCQLTCEDILDYAEFIYKTNEEEEEAKSEVENFTSVIAKDLNIYQQGRSRQLIPFQIRLHYPHIKVKPSFIKFGEVLLYRSQKTIISIYNLTGAVVSFEILKTTEHDDFEISPNFGEIEGSTGVNTQLVDVAVYFTPRHCKNYSGNLRVITNIPQYYVDIPVTGSGSNNEKFNVD